MPLNRNYIFDADDDIVILPDLFELRINVVLVMPFIKIPYIEKMCKEYQKNNVDKDDIL